MTGCRQSEAAYIVFNRSIKDNDYIVRHNSFSRMATVPASDTKTDKDYFWLISASHTKIMDMIVQNINTGFASAEALKKSLKAYFREQTLKKADIPVHHSGNRLYNMRSIRSFHATEWVKLVLEYRLMGWTPEPPNPLQHESERMTIDHYATKGVTNKVEVQQRCLRKYANDP